MIPGAVAHSVHVHFYAVAPTAHREALHAKDQARRARDGFTAQRGGNAVAVLDPGRRRAGHHVRPTPGRPRRRPGQLSDSLTPKWRANFEARNQAALEKQVRTGIQGDSVKLGKGKYGRVGTAQNDKIFVVLAEFGDTQHAAYPGPCARRLQPARARPAAQRDPASRIAPRTTRRCGSRTTTTAHYQNMYFNRMKSFYEDQSSRQVLDRRQGHRVGEGAVQRGPLRS